MKGPGDAAQVGGAKDPEIYGLWQTMNGWVYEGFDKTYEAMGVSFDKVYYRSNTYLLGKSIVEEGLDKGCFSVRRTARSGAT